MQCLLFLFTHMYTFYNFISTVPFWIFRWSYASYNFLGDDKCERTDNWCIRTGLIKSSLINWGQFPIILSMLYFTPKLFFTAFDIEMCTSTAFSKNATADLQHSNTSVPASSSNCRNCLARVSNWLPSVCTLSTIMLFISSPMAHS